MERISSRQNAIVKRFRDLARASRRCPSPPMPAAAAPSMILLDGEHLVQEALLCDIADRGRGVLGQQIDSVLSPAARIAREIEKRGGRVVIASDQVLAAHEPGAAPVGGRRDRPRPPGRRPRRHGDRDRAAAGARSGGPAGSGQRRRDRARRGGVRRLGRRGHRRARPIRSAGRRCAAPWAARSACRSPRAARCPTSWPRRRSAACASSPPSRAAARRCRSSISATHRHRPRRRRRGGAADDDGGGARDGDDSRCSRRSNRSTSRSRRRSSSTRRRDSASPARTTRAGSRPARGRPCLMDLFADDEPVRHADAGEDRSLRSARRADAAPHHRRHRRPGGAARSGTAAARRDRARPAAVDHPVGPARDRQDDARAGDRQRDAGALHRVQRGDVGDQGNPRGDGGSGAGAPPLRRPHDPVHRRDPPLQQGPAGRVPSRASSPATSS